MYYIDSGGVNFWGSRAANFPSFLFLMNIREKEASKNKKTTVNFLG
jgi:hypothetical protein